MQYLLLIYSNEKDEANLPEDKQREVFGEWMAYTEDMKANKVFVAGDALQPTGTATSVRVRNGDRMVSDGPFAETKEQLGGYYLIEVQNLDQALEWAGKCPGARTGTATEWRRRPESSRRPHGADIREIAERYGVSETLVRAIVRAESGFDPAAVSPKGAGGLMQLMPQTASALGVVDRFDPRENVTGGVRHLRYLLDRYRGSVPMALAAYNAGERPVDAHGGIPPYPETQQYVRRVMREAGLRDTHSASHVLYRSVGPDETITYSNIRPTSRESRLLPRHDR